MKVLSVFFLSAILSQILAINADIQAYVFRDSNNSFVEIIYFIPTQKLQKNYKPSSTTNTSERDSSFQYQVKLELNLKMENKIIRSESYMLNSPFLMESKALLHQFRWEMPAGVYTLESKLIDAFNVKDELTFINNFQVDQVSAELKISSIQLFRSVKNVKTVSSTLYKHGFEYEPIPYQTIDRDQNILLSYCEIYSIPQLKDKTYALKFELSAKDSLNNFYEIEEWYKSGSTIESGIILNQKDVSDLPSGHYRLDISLIDKSNSTIISNSVEFDRYNPFWDRLVKIQYDNQRDKEFFDLMKIDSVNYYLRALNAILPSLEKNEISLLNKKNNPVEKRMYLYRFWKDRFDTACIDRFRRFQKNVEFANAGFPTGFGYGFESHRGIIYLKYGPPTEVISENQDNGAYPYEIWIYNKMANGQANVKFLFYNPDLTETNYILLNSTHRDEYKNPRWELELYRKVKEEYDGANPVEATRIKKSVNRRARDYFDY